MQNMFFACLNSKYMAKEERVFPNFMRLIRRTSRTFGATFSIFLQRVQIFGLGLVGPRSIGCRSPEPLRLK
jgi:hypothetical protein